MSFVQFEGWETGLDKIALNKLIRHYSELGLADAKDAVDRIVNGEKVTVPISSPSAAEELITAARGIGARCSLRRQSA
jgi:ribosomal protein L7/L12